MYKCVIRLFLEWQSVEPGVVLDDVVHPLHGAGPLDLGPVVVEVPVVLVLRVRVVAGAPEFHALLNMLYLAKVSDRARLHYVTKPCDVGHMTV